MTKAQYIDFIRNSLQMVDKTSKYHQEQVAAAINNAVNTLFWEMYERNPKVMRKSLERYTTLVSSTTALNATSNRWNSTLTVDVVDLPRKAGGIIDIITTSTTTTTYVPLTSMEGDQLYGSESSLPDNVIGFSFNGARAIEYWNMTGATSVVIRLIKQFRSYALTDNVVLPYGQDEKIVELVREYLGGIPPKDLVNNEADIQK